MKHVQNPRRGRGRGGPGKRHQPSRNRNFESSGGEAKIRGNAQQVLDKYQAMARDAAAAGEHIQAEGYWQHAEHYYRILNADKDNRPVNRGNNAGQGNNGDGLDSTETKNTPRPDQPDTRQIPIETPVEIPAEATEPRPAQPVRLTEQAAAVEQPPVEPEQPKAEKPKRRGRPRKVAVDSGDKPETPDTGEVASPESVSA